MDVLDRAEPSTFRALREAAGLSQDALADLAGVSQTAISKLEKGATRNPGYSTLNKLAGALHTTPDELMAAILNSSAAA